MTCLPWKQTRGARIGYLQAHSEAEQRLKRDERQRQCPDCLRWYWADEHEEHVLTYDSSTHQG